jgi:CRP/FNR family transcriptional regulator, cyclic AMP receptor protein
MNTSLPAVDLRLIPVFEGMDDDVLQRLNKGAQLISKPRFRYLYLPGDPAEEMYFLLEGHIKLGVYGTTFKENIREILHAPGYFGEMTIAGENSREGFALTMGERNLILAVDASLIRDTMAGNAMLQSRMLKILGARLRQAEHRVEDLINKDAKTRIIDYLRQVVRERGRQIGYEIHLRHDLTQQDIASITGTSRQTVTQVLNDLRKSNLIHFARQNILVRDISKLDNRTVH